MVTAHRPKLSLSSYARLLTIVVLMLALSSASLFPIVRANNTPQTLPFSQDWSNKDLIKFHDDWSSVPGILGYRGDDFVTTIGTDPQTILGDGATIPFDLIANQSDPNSLSDGGVGEFDGISNPSIALQASNIADAPFLLISVRTTGLTNIKVSYKLRDLDGSNDNVVQPVALQYRVGSDGNFTNLPAGFVADATSGPNLATQVTTVNVTLPAAAENRSLVQLRIITSNQQGNDEWVGIDDIGVTSGPVAQLPALSVNNLSLDEGNSGATAFNFTVSLSAPAPSGGVSFNIATKDNTATTANNDYAAKNLTAQSIPAGSSNYAFTVNVNGDTTHEPNETFYVTVTNVVGAAVADDQGTGTILNDDAAPCPSLVFVPETLANAMQGVSYNAIISVQGGQGGSTPYSFALTSGILPDGLSLSGAGTISGVSSKTGNFNFTVTASGRNGCGGSQNYSIAVGTVTTSIVGTGECVGRGSIIKVNANVTNSSTAAQGSSLTSTLPSQLPALPGSCATNAGSCTIVNASTISWSGELKAGQIANINYQVQVADNVSSGAEFCINSSAKIGTSSPSTISTCATVNCPPVGPGIPPEKIPTSSGQKAGSVLIYNIYTSGTDSNGENTKINITNVEPTRSTFVHMFFVDGSTCSVADYSFCLTPSQTANFLISEFDPGTTGYIIAVAVDRNGCPINFNYLIGDEYVKFASGHAANLNAVAVSAVSGSLATCDSGSSTATLAFDGVSYDVLPYVLAVDNIPSRADGNETMLILNRIGGNLGLNADTLGGIFGIMFDDKEAGGSFGIIPGTCQYRDIISSSSIRTVPRIEQRIPTGHSGWIKLFHFLEPAAMTGAVINFNPNADAVSDAYNQGRNLHALSNIGNTVITIPVFPPNC